MACLAPMIAAAIMWLITRSPYSLMFAVLGPVMAIGSMIDGRVSGRRRLRRKTAEYEGELADVGEEILSVHEREREARFAREPTSKRILGHADEVGRWRGRGEHTCDVALGIGTANSSVALTGAVEQPSHTDLVGRAARISDVPRSADARVGIAVVGPLPLARSICRGYLLQLCHRLDPTSMRIAELPETGWEWAYDLPHIAAQDAHRVRLSVVEGAVTSDQDSDITLAYGQRVDSVPACCTHVVVCTDTTQADWRDASDPAWGEPLAVSPVTAAEGRRFSTALGELAKQAGLDGRARQPPDEVSWGETGMIDSGPTTAVTIGRAAEGPYDVDLVSEGPHAVIGGTTGSGKSELLSTWVLGLAAANSPQDVSMLLVDFKGGATFEPLRRLPHVVGVITDLDPAGAERALQSLRAEVRHRERVLREQGVHDAAACPDALGRLVIVVDEFGAMLDGSPGLHSLFVDIAARGRSLGLHLILCTQRPSGVVRDALLANCTLRMSLRVNNRADSAAVIGSDTAASLPSSPAGRCVVASPDREQETIQIAQVHASDIDRVVGRHRSEREPRRPWLDPLPSQVELSSLARGPDAFTLGLCDLPEEQRQEEATWQPDRDGSILVLGASGSGKSTLLAALHEQEGQRWRVEALPEDLERAFDLVQELVRRVDGTPSQERRSGTVLVIDDIDALWTRLEDDEADHMKELLVRTLRSGPRVGIRCVVTAQRVGHGLSSVFSLFEQTLMLRMNNRQEHILAGGESGTWREGRVPGNGTWDGHDIQLAHCPLQKRAAYAYELPLVDVGPGERVLICCQRPQAVARWLRGRVHVPVVTLTGAPGHSPSENPQGGVIVGDVDAWNSSFSLLQTLRRDATMIVESCSPTDYRSFTRSRVRPPYLHREPGRAWRIAEDGFITRCALPSLEDGSR